MCFLDEELHIYDMKMPLMLAMVAWRKMSHSSYNLKVDG
jgi:hypothetical protein